MFLFGHIHYEGYSGIVDEIYAIWIFLYGHSLIHGCRQNSLWIGLILRSLRADLEVYLLSTIE